MVREITRNAYAVVTVDDALKLVRFYRTSVQLPNVKEAADFFGGFAKLIPMEERAKLRLLLDVRDGPARNDPEFEAVLTRHQGAAFAGFERAAILLKTAAGKLQSNRLARGAKGAPVPFHDEKEALVFLANG